ncbi:hypothetical protein EBZ37_11540 [bacterium]|nr:hypothetical protein [bacterium]
MVATAAHLRAEVQARRKGLDESERSRIQAFLDQQFLNFLKQELHPRRGQLMGLYRPLPWEWSVPRTTQFLRECGVLMAYPKMRDPADRLKGMSWHLADEADPSHWRPSTRLTALLEPNDELPKIDPTRIHSVWVPGVAFSKQGERMGTGGGFYDVFLSRYPHLISIALAADFQVFDSLPGQRPDEPRMNYLVSETGIFSFSGKE